MSVGQRMAGRSRLCDRQLRLLMSVYFGGGCNTVVQGLTIEVMTVEQQKW